MRYEFVVTVEVERVEGLFATRDEIGDQVREALELADYSQWEGDNGGQYETQDWAVEEQEKKR